MKRLALLCLFLAGCIQPGGVSMEFTAGPCDESVDVYNEAELGVKDAVWVDGELHVKVFVGLNCAEEIRGGSYEVSGDVITLTYYSTHCGGDVFPCARCNCAHQLDYRFSGLEAKDYSFELREEWSWS
jgi:hypothetical protein